MINSILSCKQPLYTSKKKKQQQKNKNKKKTKQKKNKHRYQIFQFWKTNSKTWNEINRKCIFYSSFIICFVKQRQVSKLMFINWIPVLYFKTCFHYRLCYSTNVDIDSSRNQPSHKWHRIKTSPAIKWSNFTVLTDLLSPGGPCTWLIQSRPSLL